jgi:hypothetical protein
MIGICPKTDWFYSRAMDLSIVFGLLIVVDVIVVRFIPNRKPVTRFAVRSLFFFHRNGAHYFTDRLALHAGL